MFSSTASGSTVSLFNNSFEEEKFSITADGFMGSGSAHKTNAHIRTTHQRFFALKRRLKALNSLDCCESFSETGN